MGQIRYFKNSVDMQATLTQFADGTWYVDMGTQLWNRCYKNIYWALRYLESNGFVETI